jgi:formylglycine-generating enzyme required for sulfatase activity
MVVVCVLLAVAAGCCPSATGRRLAAAETAAAEGLWGDAFVGYLAVVRSDPTDAVAQAQLVAAAENLIAEVPDLPVDVEVELLRWLEVSGRLGDVLGVLEASMVTVPAGWGPMGTAGGRDSEQPQRSVYLDAYRVDRYEVTNLQYAAFAAVEDARSPRHWIDGSYPQGAAAHPTVGVTWHEAAAYCRWAGKRLPTEAEWERACAGTSGATFPWGTDWEPARANVTLLRLRSLDDAWPWLRPGTDPPASLVPVGEPVAGASVYGVCNLADNASEWVADWYDSRAYLALPVTNPLAEGPTWSHSVRGGSWLFPHADPELLVDQSRCAFRGRSHSGLGEPRLGFRCAADGN